MIMKEAYQIEMLFDPLAPAEIRAKKKEIKTEKEKEKKKTVNETNRRMYCHPVE